MKIFQCELTKEIQKEVRGAIIQDILEKNLPYQDSSYIGLCLRDENNKNLAILSYRISWHTIHIKHFAVIQKQNRKSGYGTKLMKALSEIAKKEKINLIFLETMSFQALDFYKKLGFEIEFTRKGLVNGVEKHFLKLDLNI